MAGAANHGEPVHGQNKPYKGNAGLSAPAPKRRHFQKVRAATPEINLGGGITEPVVVW